MADQVYMGDDVPIAIDTQEDLSSATGTKIFYKSPGGTQGYWPATVDGSNLVFNAFSGEFNEIGLWQLEGQYKIGTRRLSTTVVTVYIDLPLSA